MGFQISPALSLPLSHLPPQFSNTWFNNCFDNASSTIHTCFKQKEWKTSEFRVQQTITFCYCFVMFALCYLVVSVRVFLQMLHMFSKFHSCYWWTVLGLARIQQHLHTLSVWFIHTCYIECVEVSIIMGLLFFGIVHRWNYMWKYESSHMMNKWSWYIHASRRHVLRGSDFWQW